jgi:L-amino acid N-acyltransferase YncA
VKEKLIRYEVLMEYNLIREIVSTPFGEMTAIYHGPYRATFIALADESKDPDEWQEVAHVARSQED